jgi:hypothetical protein
MQSDQNARFARTLPPLGDETRRLTFPIAAVQKSWINFGFRQIAVLRDLK